MGHVVAISESLNERAWHLCQSLQQRTGDLRVESQQSRAGTTIHDFGIQTEGSLEAGRLLAEICLAGRARVEFTSTAVYPAHGPAVMVRTDNPVAACMASQYAGWQISEGDFFAMGSGPMRAAASREPLLRELDCGEEATRVVGVLETSKLPPDEVCRKIARECHVEAKNLTICVAPTASMAGAVQVVARSVETALHKMHELGLDIRRVVSGFGTAPLPPISADDLEAIGRTNDAVLYGGQVTLWVRDDDEHLDDSVSKIPSQASRDYGVPFIHVFQKYDGDFYQIDPHLFSPATIRLVNLNSGRSFEAGELRLDVLKVSFS